MFQLNPTVNSSLDITFIQSSSNSSLYVVYWPSTRSNMPFQVMHRKEVTHSDGSYEKKSLRQAWLTKWDIVHSYTDAPEESDLWTAWQLFPLDDDQTCHSKDWVGDWTITLLSEDRKSVRWRSEKLEKWCGRESHHSAEGASGPPSEFGDPLVTRCGRESRIQRSELPGLRLSCPGERERHNADGHKSEGQYVELLFGLQLPLTHKPLQKSERYIFLKKSSLGFYSLCQYVFCMYMCICIWVYNID